MKVPFKRGNLFDDEYTGRMKLLDVRSPEDSIIPNISLDDFYKLLFTYGWCFETSKTQYKNDFWSLRDGQCAVTAAFIYDVFGGKIIKPSAGHYANEINGVMLDFTSWDGAYFPKIKPRYIPRWMTCKGKDASARLELLKQRVFTAIKEQGLE